MYNMEEQDDKLTELRSESAPPMHDGSNPPTTSRKRRHSDILPVFQGRSNIVTLKPMRRHSSCDQPEFDFGPAKRACSIDSRQGEDLALLGVDEEHQKESPRDVNVGQADNGDLLTEKQDESSPLPTETRNVQESESGGSSERHIITPRRRRRGIVQFDSPMEVAVSNPAILDGGGAIPRSQPRAVLQNQVMDGHPNPQPATARRRRFGVVTAPVQFAGARTLGELLSVCNKDDFTEWELRKIADEIPPDTTPQLGCLLGANVEEMTNTEYEYMQHPENQAIAVLKFWHSTTLGEGVQKRKKLIERLYDMNKLNLAEMVATKSYV